MNSIISDGLTKLKLTHESILPASDPSSSHYKAKIARTVGELQNQQIRKNIIEHGSLLPLVGSRSILKFILEESFVLPATEAEFIKHQQQPVNPRYAYMWDVLRIDIQRSREFNEQKWTKKIGSRAVLNEVFWNGPDNYVKKIQTHGMFLGQWNDNEGQFVSILASDVNKGTKRTEKLPEMRLIDQLVVGAIHQPTESENYIQQITFAEAIMPHRFNLNTALGSLASMFTIPRLAVAPAQVSVIR